jgi:hypothetical protein
VSSESRNNTAAAPAPELGQRHFAFLAFCCDQTLNPLAALPGRILPLHSRLRLPDDPLDKSAAAQYPLISQLRFSPPALRFHFGPTSYRAYQSSSHQLRTSAKLYTFANKTPVRALGIAFPVTEL